MYTYIVKYLLSIKFIYMKQQQYTCIANADTEHRHCTTMGTDTTKPAKAKSDILQLLLNYQHYRLSISTFDSTIRSIYWCCAEESQLSTRYESGKPAILHSLFSTRNDIGCRTCRQRITTKCCENDDKEDDYYAISIVVKYRVMISTRATKAPLVVKTHVGWSCNL